VTVFQGAQLVPGKIFFTKGIGTHREKLVSFEMALRSAGIAQHNLVRISSIFPPECEVVEREEGAKLLRAGQVVFCVLSEAQSNEPGRRVGAAVAVAMPKDRSMYGYISEHHAFGQNEKAMGDYAEDLAAQMLATVLGAPFHPDEAWDERKEQWRLSGHVVDSMNHTCVALAPESGDWVTVVSAAVICG
jgi:arginine decarboxylase